MVDTLGIIAAAWIAMAVRYDAFADLARVVPHAVLLTVILLAVRTIVDTRLGLYAHDWRFASVPDLQRIIVACLLGSAITAAVFVLGNAILTGLTRGLPRSFWPIEFLVTLTVIGGSRFGIRAASDLVASSRATGKTQRATLLYGAGDVGVVMARSARRLPQAGVTPVGFLDDDRRLTGSRIAGLRVYGGLDALADAVQDTGAQMLLITFANAPGAAIRRIVEAATALRLEVRTVPSIVEMLDGTVDPHRVREVRVEDLLRRPAATEHAPEVTDAFHDRVIMITGAGGSIGAELARQVMAVGPRRVVLVDRAESALFQIHRDLCETFADSGIEIRMELANVASRTSMSRIVDRERPHVILHAAAYKHVPMMEQHPADAVHVNIAGTMVLLDAAIEAGVDRFVLVSTDKAVNPSSVMGASKRVAELLVADTARRTGRPYVSVRFGNVLGSNGSVVPIFTDQLERGRPITVTHPDMTRYFMTIPEASWLILDAAALGQPGDLFVLDMGEPIRIMDLARDVIRLAGRDPDGYPIEVMGLRPGEKLQEELFYDKEHAVATSTAKVLRAIAEPPPDDVRARVGRLLEHATGAHDEELRNELFGIVTGMPADSHGATKALGVAIPVIAEPVASRTEMAVRG